MHLLRSYILLITEKPEAARRIAEALDSKEKPERKRDNGVPYYKIERGREIIIVPALGHLYTVAPQKTGRPSYPVFDYHWAPRYLAERKAKQTRNWLETISKLAKDADTFIDACDYDIEGSLIGYNILKHACKGKEADAKRMKYSTLTRYELEKAYEQLLPHLDFALIEAGMARHEVDWLYGINLTRALTTAVKKYTGRYLTLSTGRVQGPTLKYVAEREKQIKTHVPVPHWQVHAETEIQGQTFLAQYEKQEINTREEAQKILKVCKVREGQIIEINTKTFHQAPPFPFNLGSLQTEAYRLFGYTPRRTLQVAQRLYLSALISYPRTSSEKLPPSINYRRVLENLNKTYEYNKLTSELLAKAQLIPNEGKKEDSAHPAIYPTGNLPQKMTSRPETNIWDLVVRRFLAVFGELATKQTVKTTITVNGHNFLVTGRYILKEGWMHFYCPYEQTKEIFLPPIKQGETVKINKIVLEDKFTLPQPRYNPSTMLKQMEKSDIGTKATRADTIQTLYNRKYVQNENMTATDLGFVIIEMLERYCPAIISTRLTRQIEEKMSKIQEGSEKKETVIEETIKILKPILEEIKRHEDDIGKNVKNALEKSLQEERTVGTCLECKTGKLVIIQSRKTGKRFIGCTNYFKNQCETAFPLPQKGTVKPLHRACNRCGWPTVLVRIYGKRPWTLCVNIACPQKQQRRRRVEMQTMW